jgi:hypothetical protein
MLWITKYKHNKIVEEYKELLKQYKEQINRKDKMEEIMDKLVDKTNTIAGSLEGYCIASGHDVMMSLDESVPRYVEDYFGGKVIKQEATPVTILDEKGKATYGLTKEAPDKGRAYKLVTK